MKKTHITKTMTEIYGTGRFNPQRFDRAGGGSPSGKRLYVWGVGLFLFAVAVAIAFGMYVFGQGGASFTGEKVSLQVSGPSNPQPGEEETYIVTVKNDEELALEDLELFIGFLTQEQGPSVELVRAESDASSEAGNSWLLKDVSSGGETTFEIVLRFVGSQSDELTVPFRLSFRPKGFSSDITVTERRSFVLGEPTISLSIDGPSSVSPGSEVALSVMLSAETGVPDENLRLSLSIPVDFEIISYEPQLAKDVLDWRVGDLLAEGNSRQLLVRGTVGSEQSDPLQFSARLRNSDGVTILDSSYETALSDAKAQLSISAAPAQGKKLQWGESVTYTITVANEASYVMRDVVVSVRISSEDLWEQGTFSVGQGGIFESGSVIWDTETTSAFESLRPGTDTVLTFSFTTRSEPPRNFTGVPALLAKGTLRANLRDEDITVESGETVMNILGTAEFDTDGWYRSPEGITYGTGPHPPLPGQDTTYAIIWTVGPTSGALEDLVIKATLPSSTVWVDDSAYSVGELSYEPSNRMVTWRASRIPKTTLPFTIRFGVGIAPTGQVPSSTELVGQSSFSAIDGPTGEKLDFFSNPVTIGSIQ